MWLSLTAAVLAAATAPQLALVPVVRPSLIEAAEATRVELLVRKTLEAFMALQPAAQTQQALAGRDPVTCEGNRACFALLADAAGAWAAVRIEAVEVAGSLTVAVQAIDAKSGDELAETHFTVAPAALEEAVATRLLPFAEKLEAKAPAPTPADVPLAAAQPVLTPAAHPAPAMVADHRAHRGPAPTLVTGGAALVLGGAAAGFFAMGLSANDCLHGAPIDGSPTVCVPYQQVQSKRTQADAGLVLGSVASALAAGLALTSLVLWATD